jgi:hypothetical protein
MNRDLLVQRGVLYPQSIANSDGKVELHRTLSVAVEPESVPWLKGLREHWIGRDVFASLREESRRVEAKVVILSAESLAFMRNPKALQLALAPYPARIVVYLRRQDNFLASFYNQLIKSRLYTATFEEFLRQHWVNAITVTDFNTSLAMCDYERFLNIWSEAFGHENISPRIFEDYDLPVGILCDLATRTGIEITGLSMPDADANPALRHSLVALKRRVNALLSSEGERILSERLFATLNDEDYSPPLSSEEIRINIVRRQSILANYEEGNRRVASEFFPGRSKLFALPNEHDAPLPDSQETEWQAPCHQIAVRAIATLVTEASRCDKEVPS